MTYVARRVDDHQALLSVLGRHLRDFLNSFDYFNSSVLLFRCLSMDQWVLTVINNLRYRLKTTVSSKKLYTKFLAASGTFSMTWTILTGKAILSRSAVYISTFSLTGGWYLNAEKHCLQGLSQRSRQPSRLSTFQLPSHGRPVVLLPVGVCQWSPAPLPQQKTGVCAVHHRSDPAFMHIR